MNATEDNQGRLVDKQFKLVNLFHIIMAFAVLFKVDRFAVIWLMITFFTGRMVKNLHQQNSRMMYLLDLSTEEKMNSFLWNLQMQDPVLPSMVAGFRIAVTY